MFKLRISASKPLLTSEIKAVVPNSESIIQNPNSSSAKFKDGIRDKTEQSQTRGTSDSN